MSSAASVARTLLIAHGASPEAADRHAAVLESACLLVSPQTVQDQLDACREQARAEVAAELAELRERLAVADPGYLPQIAGMAATRHEVWAPCLLAALERGRVLTLPGGLRPSVLVHCQAEARPGGPTVLSGTVHHVSTDQAETFELPATASVLTRCDLQYTHGATEENTDGN
jgi:hypothetical protein